MDTKYFGKATLSLSKPDAAGNVGYSLTFRFTHNTVNPEESIQFFDIEFSGPGSWDEYSEGEDFPYNLMRVAALPGN